MIVPKNETAVRNAESNQGYRRYAKIIVIACVGLFLTLSAFFIVRRLEIQSLKTELQLHAQGYVNAVEKEISINFNALQSLNSFFKSTEVVSRKEFRTFTKDILQYIPGFQALEWIPRVLRSQREEYERAARLDGFRNFQITERREKEEMVRTGEREEYFPVYFVEPYKGNEIALGYDLASNPARKAALEKCRDTGQMTATARITLVQETGQEYGFLVFLPVYQKKTSTDTIESRRKNLTGFVLGVYRVATIANNAFKSPEELTMHMYDRLSPPGENFLYSYSGQPGNNFNQLGSQDGFKISRQLNVADRQWQMMFELTSDFVGPFRMVASWGVLASGLLLTCLLAVYLSTYMKRTVQIEGMANRLSAEIAERKKASEELQRSEEKYRLLFEGSTNGIMAFDIETKRFVYANPAALKMFGYSEIELEQISIADFHPKDSLVHVMSEFEPQVRGEKITSSALPCLRKDGTIFYADITGANTIIDGKKCFVGFITDATERKRWENAVREGGKRYRDLFENSTDFVYTLDLKGNFTDVNKAAEELTGYTKNQLIGMNYKDYTPEATHERTREAFDNVFNEAKPLKDFPLEVIIKDGTKIYFETCVSPLKKGEEIIGFQGSSRDITERKQAEEALRDEATRRRILVEQSRDGIVILDQNGKVYEANQQYADMLGYSMEEILRVHVWDWDTQFPREQLLEMLRTVDDAGDHFETRHRKKDGTFYDVEISTNGAVYRGQKLIFCICRDITERKQAEAKIKEYAEKLERMVDKRTKELNRALYDTEEARDKIDGILKSVADGLIVTDLYNRVILMNRAAEELLGVRFSEIIDRPIDFAIEDKTLRDQIKTTLDKKESGYQFDFELPGDNSTHPRIIRARTSIIKDKSGTQTGIITTMNDVTYEREVDRMKTEFISTAAHELRTPLTSILGFSEVLLNQDNLPPEEKTEFMGYINTQSKSLSKVIDDLLDISRIESGQGFSMSKEPCDPLEITKKVVSYYEKQSPQHQFKVMFPKKPVEIMADRDKLEQAVKNLIDNAVKYSPDGGAIRIRGKKVDDQYQVSVEDQGIGMTQEQVEKIFDKFYRAKDAFFISKGTGLGMSIVKHIVEFHGGKVWVESEHGKGTTVHFTVPIGEEIGK